MEVVVRAWSYVVTSIALHYQ